MTSTTKSRLSVATMTRIAILALNPKCVEGTPTDKEEMEIIIPAVEELENKGYHLRYACAGSFVDPEEGQRWKEQVEEAFPGKEVWYDPLSLVVCAHTGPDAFGVGVSVAYDPE